MTETTTVVAELVRLPHTGLRVPDTTMSVSRVSTMEGSDGYILRANLKVKGKVVGAIRNDGNGGETYFSPDNWRAYGDKEVQEYAGRCRTEEGGEVSVEWLFEQLVSEHEWKLRVRNMDAKGRLMLRRMAFLMATDTEPVRDWPPTPQGWADSLIPGNEKQRAALRAELADWMRPGPYSWWQAWHKGRWEDMTPRPDGVDANLYG